MILKSTKSALHGHYENVADYLEDATRFGGGSSKSQHDYWLNYTDSDWFGLDYRAGFEDIKSLVGSGWQDGAEKMGSNMGKIEAKQGRCIKRRNVWSDQGDTVDMQRVYNGDLDRAWRRPHRVPVYGPRRIRIVVESIEVGCNDSERMFWRGAAAVLLADILTEAGYATELVSGYYGSASGCEILSSVVTKDYMAPVDISSVAATTAMPAFFRSIGHAWYKSHCKAEHYGSGMMVEQILNRKSFFKGDEDYTCFATQKVGTLQQAQAWIAENLDAIENYDPMQDAI